MKLLSAGSPLSLQAHPSRTQAELGYAQESLYGIPLSAAERSFKDDWPKPEVIIALEPFEGLMGFRHPVASAGLFEALGLGEALSSVIGPLRERTTTPALQEVFLDVLSLGERRHLVDEVLAAAVRHLDAPEEIGLFARTAVELDEHFPGDPSILAALLLNRFKLQPGEALTLGAGIMHAYLKGTGVEVMANSDNVLRGGLTKKHIDVDALLQVVRFEPSEVNVLLPEGSDGVYCYPTTVSEFEVWLISPTGPGGVDLPAATPAASVWPRPGPSPCTGTTARWNWRRASRCSSGQASTSTCPGTARCSCPPREPEPHVALSGRSSAQCGDCLRSSAVRALAL